MSSSKRSRASSSKDDGKPQGAEALGFEEALGRLGKTVEALEAGDLGLDDALARYEEGVSLLVRCRSLLDSAERRVALLTDVDDQGTPRTEPFDTQAATDRPTTPRVVEPDLSEDDAPF